MCNFKLSEYFDPAWPFVLSLSKLPEAQSAEKKGLLGWFQVIDRKQSVTRRMSDRKIFLAL